MSIKLLENEFVRLERHHDEEQDGASSIIYYQLTMKAGENRLDPIMNEQLLKCLQMTEEDAQHHLLLSNRVAFLLTGTGKYFSLGLDLPSYYSTALTGNYHSLTTPQQVFHHSFDRLVATLLRFPIITIAVINGHVIAGGMILAMACDYRLMRDDRGFMAMNEIHLPSSIPQSMVEVIKAKVGGDDTLRREILIQGKRFTSVEAKQRGLIDRLVMVELKQDTEPDQILMYQAREMALEKAHPWGKGPFLRVIKQGLYAETLYHLLTREEFDHFQFAKQVTASDQLDDRLNSQQSNSKPMNKSIIKSKI